jgi:hypothetical protein
MPTVHIHNLRLREKVGDQGEGALRDVVTLQSSKEKGRSLKRDIPTVIWEIPQWSHGLFQDIQRYA